MFVLPGNNNTGKQIFTLKFVPPDRDYMRQQFRDIVPGYYMAKQHWNSVDLEENVPDDLLMDLIDKMIPASLLFIN